MSAVAKLIAMTGYRTQRDDDCLRGYNEGIEAAASMLEAVAAADERLGPARIKALPALIRTLAHTG